MMKRLLPLTSIFVLAALAISAADAPRVSRVLMTTVEKNLDDRIIRLWTDNPMTLVGNARGVYLPGYGIVFSAEVNLATANVSLMNPTVTDADKVVLRKKKVERLPQLKDALKKALVDVAASMDPVPTTDQVVIAVILPRYTWEENLAVPLQLTAQATRQQLLAARSNPASLDTIVKMTESF